MTKTAKKVRETADGEMVVTSMRIARTLREALVAKAAAEGTTVNYQIARALEAWVGRTES